MFERKSSKAEKAEPERFDTPAPAPATAPAAPAPTRTASHSGAKAMIGAKVKISGDIQSSEDLLIEGEVHGTITLADNELVVGNSGRVKADVEAKAIRIEGSVEGDIVGHERVVITASGDVQGNLIAPRVVLEDGGRFKGSIDMGGSQPASKAPKPARSESTEPASGGAKNAELPGMGSKAGG